MPELTEGESQQAASRRGRRPEYDSDALNPARRVLRPGRRAIIAIALTALAALVLPSAAPAVTAVPRSGGSPNADSIAELYRIILFFGVIVFLALEAVLIIALVRYRASKGAKAEGPTDNRNLELGWTVGAALLVTVIAIISFIKLPSITTPPNGGNNGISSPAPQGASLVSVPNPPNGKKYVINVTGRQYIWRYTYGDTLASPYVFTEMVAPADTVVVLRIQATDVIHSWWIPALGGKFDAVPGSTNYTWFKAPMPKNPGGDVYRGQCAELCGQQHANMLASVRVVTPAAFKIWLADQKSRITNANLEAVKNRQKLTTEGQIPNLTPPPN